MSDPLGYIYALSDESGIRYLLAAIARREYRHGPEQKAKMRARAAGRKQDPEVVRARAEKVRGRRHTPEARAKMSAALVASWERRRQNAGDSD